MRHARPLAFLVLALALAGCPGDAPPTTAGASAQVAATARTAIDAAEVVRVETLRWAGGAFVREEITAEQQARILAAAVAVEGAETVANAELAAYLAGGPRQALDLALADLLGRKLAMIAAKGSGP